MNKRILYVLGIMMSSPLWADSFPLGFTNIKLNPQTFCGEEALGSIEVSAQSDHPENIVYTLNPNGPNTVVIAGAGAGPVTFSDLPAGPYVIRIQDDSAAEPIRDASVQLGFVTTGLSITKVDVTNVTVAGEATGKIVIRVRGGVGSITVVVNNVPQPPVPVDPSGETLVAITNRPKGVYTIQLSSQGECGPIVLTLPIRQPAE